MKKGIIVAIIVVIIAAGGAYLLMRGDGSNTPATTSESTTSASATITYSDNGFSPSSITVASDTTVTIKNSSSRQVQFDSDPHPAHTDNEELNEGVVEPGQSQTFVATRKGTFGYHNHLNESETGTIIVQ